MYIQNKQLLYRIGLSCRFNANCPLVGLEPKGGVPSVLVFLRDNSPYLCEFRRKPWKTPNGKVDKRDQGLNLAPAFSAVALRHWWGFLLFQKQNVFETQKLCDLVTLQILPHSLSLSWLLFLFYLLFIFSILQYHVLLLYVAVCFYNFAAPVIICLRLTKDYVAFYFDSK